MTRPLEGIKVVEVAMWAFDSDSILAEFGYDNDQVIELKVAETVY